MLRQPTEVLEHVVDELDQREDLLSLALTCGRLRDLILPEHLPYRRIVVSVYFKPFFDLILTRSDLAKRVRELTLVNTTSNLVIPRGHSFRRQLTESRLLHESEDEDDSDYSDDDDTDLRRRLGVRKPKARHGRRCTTRLEEYWEVEGRMLCERHMHRVIGNASRMERAQRRVTRFIDIAGLR